MKKLKNTISVIIFILLIPLAGFSGTIRKSVWAGKFYPKDKAALIEMITTLTEKAARNYDKNNNNENGNRNIKALILPHAGYIYSGFTAAHAGPLLKSQNVKKVILMGPDHRVGFSNGAISNVTEYETPLGKIHLHSDAKALSDGYNIFRSIPDSDVTEHSLEVILPFLQSYLKNFEFVPIVLGEGNIDQYAKAIKSKIDENTLVVASSDLSHFFSYDDAVKRDKETISLILENKIDELKIKDNAACGIIPIMVLLKISMEKGWKPVFINYTNSGDTAGDKKRVVGYSTIAFY